MICMTCPLSALRRTALYRRLLDQIDAAATLAEMIEVF
jgi:hypothetical protein